MKTFILIISIMNFNGVGVTSAEFNSFNNCVKAGNTVVEENKGKTTFVKFYCVEK